MWVYANKPVGRMDIERPRTIGYCVWKNASRRDVLLRNRVGSDDLTAFANMQVRRARSQIAVAEFRHLKQAETPQTRQSCRRETELVRPFVQAPDLCEVTPECGTQSMTRYGRIMSLASCSRMWQCHR